MSPAPKPASELTDLEAEKELTELLGGCWHEELGCPMGLDKCAKCDRSIANLIANGLENKPYATSYDALFPVIHSMTPRQKHKLMGKFQGHGWVFVEHFKSRQLLNAVIEVKRAA